MIKDAIDASLAHLQSSVDWALMAPFPLDVLAARLAASGAAFDAGIDWTFSIFDQGQTRVLGGVALHRAEPALTALVGPDALETGYWLRADCTGRGYATEATACLIDLAFSTLGAARVVICHDPANVASEGVPRRLGFRYLDTVSQAILPGRRAADGSLRLTKVWVLDSTRA